MQLFANRHPYVLPSPTESPPHIQSMYNTHTTSHPHMQARAQNVYMYAPQCHVPILKMPPLQNHAMPPKQKHDSSVSQYHNLYLHIFMSRLRSKRLGQVRKTGYR